MISLPYYNFFLPSIKLLGYVFIYFSVSYKNAKTVPIYGNILSLIFKDISLTRHIKLIIQTPYVL